MDLAAPLDDETGVLGAPRGKDDFPNGIPGPSGGNLSLSLSPSSDVCLDSLDLARGVDVRGGKTKSDCLAVSGTSPRMSGAGDFSALLPRTGECDIDERTGEGGGFVSSKGRSNPGIRNGSGVPVSSSNNIRKVGGTFDEGGGRTVVDEASPSSSTSTDSDELPSGYPRSREGRARTVSNSQGLSSTSAGGWESLSSSSSQGSAPAMLALVPPPFVHAS